MKVKYVHIITTVTVKLERGVRGLCVTMAADQDGRGKPGELHNNLCVADENVVPLRRSKSALVTGTIEIVR